MVPHYLVENRYIGVKRCRHGLFMFNRNDRFIGRSLDLYGEWCEPEIELLLGFLGSGDVAVDLGANIGTHAVAFAHAVGAAGSVIALEPQRQAFQLLCGNVAINCLANVQALQKAASDATGTARVPVIPADEVHNFGAVSLRQEGSGEKVQVMTVDSLELKSCRLIKIDVEGMEREAIKGASATIAAHHPILFVENNTLDRASRTIAAVLESGYRAWWHLALYYNEANFFNNPDNVFDRYQPEANLLCMPAGAEPGRPDLIECTGADDSWKMALQRGMAARNPRFFPKP